MVKLNMLTDDFFAGESGQIPQKNSLYPIEIMYLQPGEPGLMPGKGENMVQFSHTRVISTVIRRKPFGTKILSIEKLVDPPFSSNFSHQKLDNPAFSSNFHSKNWTIHLSQAIFHSKNWTIHLSQVIFTPKIGQSTFLKQFFTPKIGLSTFLKQFSPQKSGYPAFSWNFSLETTDMQCLPGKVMTGMSIKEKNLKYKHKRRNQNDN